jgi:hypothetical protein
MPKAPSPSSKPRVFTTPAGITFTPSVQVGSDFLSSNDDYVVVDGNYLASAANLYVQIINGDPDAIYVYYSTNQGINWLPMPNNQQVNVSGQNPIAWWLYVPYQVVLNFLMGPG